MKDDKIEIKKVIKDIEKLPEVRKLPGPIRDIIKENLESMNKIIFPVVTFNENDWIIATTPLMDLYAQGKTEDEAVDCLKAMIDDFMTDPYTDKPKIRSIMNLQVAIKTVPISIPLERVSPDKAMKTERAASDAR